MAETAALLVEHVFPQVPVRQWVIEAELRRYCARPAFASERLAWTGGEGAEACVCCTRTTVPIHVGPTCGETRRMCGSCL